MATCWPKERISTARKKPITLNEEQVKACFEGQTDQHTVIVNIYRLVFPAFDEIARIDGWPMVNNRTWEKVARMFMAFDKAHHPSVMPGGCWMNHGFSTVHGEPLKDWQVSLQGVVIHWTEAA